MAPNETVARANSALSEMDEKVKLDVHNEEVAMAKLTEEDLYNLSRESLTFSGRPALRICLIMLVMGCNQAGMSIFIAAEVLTDSENRLRCRLGCYFWNQLFQTLAHILWL